jgi:outer membrane protein OmpA-like peptidoglycan-associated protein
LADGNVEIVFSQQIQFEVGKADIKPESNDFLAFIAKTILSHTELAEKKAMIEISGHTDNDGKDKDNVTLSQKRSEAVRTALINLGVSAKILRGKGYGPYCPVDSANTPAAKAKNRRVQFLVLKWDGKKTTAAVGCDNAAKNGVKPLPLP